MTKTQIYLHGHAVGNLRNLAHPDKILSFIERLKTNPLTVGDYRQADPQGRMIEVKILGRHAILFFKDPFAGIIKILDIRNTEAS